MLCADWRVVGGGAFTAVAGAGGHWRGGQGADPAARHDPFRVQLLGYMANSPCFINISETISS